MTASTSAWPLLLTEPNDHQRARSPVIGPWDARHFGRPSSAMRVNFLLPTFSRVPSGGLKVQYELANRLSRMGHDVAVYHDANFNSATIKNIRAVPGLLRWALMGRRVLTWFALDTAVKCYFVPIISPRLLRRADATIYNSFLIADRLPAATSRTGPLFEIVYEYPVWKYGTDELRAHLQRSLRRSDVGHIATCEAVERMLAEMDVQAWATITCGIDLPDPATVTPTNERSPIVGFPVRPELVKGSADILRAVPAIAERCPNARFECFGWHGGDLEVPPYVKFHGYLEEAELSAFYRRCMVFVLPSHAEGWGLPAAEAMANGAAVVVADNGGSSDFAIHEQTALVVPTHDPSAIVEATARLLNDERLRSGIVEAGRLRCASMSWDEPVARLASVLSSATKT